MVIQNTIVDAVNRAMSGQSKETAVSTIDLAKMIEDGEKQLEGLFARIKAAEREVTYLKDRVEGQRDTINKLQAELQQCRGK